MLLVAVSGVVLVLFHHLGVQHQAHLVESAASSDLGYEQAARYGDSFGFVNSLFSGLAFAGVVVALVIQSLEFSLASTERREQIAAQTRIMEQQVLSARISAIETLQTLNAARRIDRDLCLRNKGYLISIVENSRLRESLTQIHADLEDDDGSIAGPKPNSAPITFAAASALVRLAAVSQRIIEIAPNSEYGPISVRMPEADDMFRQVLISEIFENKAIAGELEDKVAGLHQNLKVAASLTRSDSYFKNTYGGLVDGYNPPEYTVNSLLTLVERVVDGIAALTGCYFDERQQDEAGVDG